MHKIAHSVILDPSVKRNISKESLDSWMLSYCRGTYVANSEVYSYLDNMWYARSVDELLTHYKDQDLDYLLINWFGAYCQDFWTWHKHCIEHIDKLNELTKWVLAGQIINKSLQKKDSAFEGQFFPYPITAIINLKEWRNIGCPKWHDVDMTSFHNPIPSVSCIHDDYTPVVMHPSNEYVSLTNVHPGNSFISKILDNGIPVHNIPISVRSTIMHTYPENDPSAWDNTMTSYMSLPIITDQKHFEFIRHALQYRNLKHAPMEREGVFFLYNTESILPKNFEKPCIAALQTTDTILSPCSMFKAFLLGSHSDTVKNYVHFDIYDRNAKWKKIITNSWNGEYDNLREVLATLGETENAFWNSGSDNIIDKQYKILLTHFGTEDKLKSAWLDYKNKNHQYVTANLLFDDKNIINAVKSIDAKIIYTAIGDIPGFMINGINYGIHNITKYTIRHLDRLKENCKNVYVDIKMPISDYQMFDNYENTRSNLLESIIKDEY